MHRQHVKREMFLGYLRVLCVALWGNLGSWGLKGGRGSCCGLLGALRGLLGGLGGWLFKGFKAHLRGPLRASWGSWAIIEVLGSLLGGFLRVTWRLLAAFWGFLKALGVLGARHASSACKQK